MKNLKATFEHRQPEARPYSTRQLMGRFDHTPRHSVTALVRRAGPFKANRDGFAFSNSKPKWPITEEDARVLRERYQSLIEPVTLVGIGSLRTALTGLIITVPLGASVGLPVAAVDFVIHLMTGELRNRLLDEVISATPERYGRCGGMAFAGYDFFQAGWPVSSFTRPASGELRQYIWTRLLDSLELNAPTFFEWLMVLHILPVISRLASAALGAAAGSVILGPLGAAVGALSAGKEDLFGLGGAGALRDLSRDHWRQLRKCLDREAAWPIGFIYEGDANPTDQHQVLALDYKDGGDGTAQLTIWDNNDGPYPRRLSLDFRGKILNVEGSDLPIRGIICEQYTVKQPPVALRR